LLLLMGTANASIKGRETAAFEARELTFESLRTWKVCRKAI